MYICTHLRAQLARYLIRSFLNPCSSAPSFHLKFSHLHLQSSLTNHSTQCIAPRFLISHKNDSNILDYLDHLLQTTNSSQQLKQIHAQIIISGSSKSEFLAARLVSTYSCYGDVFGARKVFGTIPSSSNSNLLWNSILRANVSNGYHGEAIVLYINMKNIGVLADGFTFPLVIRACTSMGGYKLSSAVHNHVLQVGLQDNIYVVNALLGLYGKLGRMDIAGKLFDRMPLRNHISWNTMVSGFSYNFDSEGACEMFKWMEVEGLEPNIITWTSLLSSHARCGHNEEVVKIFSLLRSSGLEVNAETLAVVLSACADLGAFVEAQMIHGYIIRGGFQVDYIVSNSLICVHGKHGDLQDACSLFLEMKTKNIVSWNSLITAYTESGLCDEALEIFSLLEKSSYEFPEMRPNLISWSAVIDGFASNGRGEEALELFRRMQLANVMTNSVTMSSTLSACAELAALALGREIHAHVIRSSMIGSLLIGNALINMYTKCGSLKEAHLVFHKLKGRDLISWNSMIAGYGMHGYGCKALDMFKEMTNEGLTPDKITFVALLSACCHAGLVSEGRELFGKMSKEFSIEPEIQHYACMVDLLGRAGHVDEAKETVKKMPMEPNASVWGALLNSSRAHKDTELAEEAASHIFNLGSSEAAGSYMLLSNVYAATGKWNDSAKVRLSARTNGQRKIAGQSWIEVAKKVYTFSSGNAQTDLEELYLILEELGLRMLAEGYVPDKNLVLQNAYDG